MKYFLMLLVLWSSSFSFSDAILSTGAGLWKATSNDYELEAGSEPGVVFAASFGVKEYDDLSLRLDFFISGNKIHGANGKNCNDLVSCSADHMPDNTLKVFAPMVGFRYNKPISNNYYVFYHVGAGVAQMLALGDKEYSIIHKAGIGVGYKDFSVGLYQSQSQRAIMSGNTTDYIHQSLMLEWKFY